MSADLELEWLLPVAFHETERIAPQEPSDCSEPQPTWRTDQIRIVALLATKFSLAFRFLPASFLAAA